MREPEATLAEHAATTDLLVTIGGDGTFLYGARLAAPHGIPVMGVNRGRLGFLTDVEVADLPAALEAFAAGRCHTQRRSMLEAIGARRRATRAPWQTLALNEVAVKSSGVAVARIRVEQDGELLGDFDADGMVVATATGSTAYALSAGGPPIDPRVRAIVVVPLAPHAVISRAIVLPEVVTLRVTVERGRVNVAADGIARDPPPRRRRDDHPARARAGLRALRHLAVVPAPAAREGALRAAPQGARATGACSRPASTEEGPPAAEAAPVSLRRAPHPAGSPSSTRWWSPVGAGFTALTGETGAGKSVCITALRLALGGRVDGDPVAPRRGRRPGQRGVRRRPRRRVRERLAGIGVAADELTTLSREVSRAGRGSCRINGALVSQAVLREVGEMLAEVTLQGASQRLLQQAPPARPPRPGRGRRRRCARSVRRAVAEWRAAQAALVRGTAPPGRRRGGGGRRRASWSPTWARWRWCPARTSALAAERLRLRNASALADGRRRRCAAPPPATRTAPAPPTCSAAAVDAAPWRSSGVDADLDRLAAEAAELSTGCASSAPRRAATPTRSALDEGRLAEVEERLDILARVRRRHGSIEQALEALDAARELLAAGEDGGARLAAAEATVERRRDARRRARAVRLSERRRQAARRLEREVDAALHLLELPHARLRVVASSGAPTRTGSRSRARCVHCGPAGIDEVEFRLATNRGAAPGGARRRARPAASCRGWCWRWRPASPRPARRCSSSTRWTPGIGGETAARVGDLLAATGAHRQVVAVTHRAEIASRAAGHLVVRKRGHAAAARLARDRARRRRRAARRDRPADVGTGHRRRPGARRRAARRGGGDDRLRAAARGRAAPAPAGR